METFEAYAPPKAAVEDAPVEAPRIPLLFKILLILLIVLDVLGRLSGSAGVGLVWDGVLAIAAWRTLAGSHAASRVLAGLLALMGALAAFVAVRMLGTNTGVACIMLALVAYMLGLVLYILFSPTMQAVFRKADARKWRGG